MLISQKGKVPATVVIGRTAALVERTAAQMLIEEIKARAGVSLPLATDADPTSAHSPLIILGTPSSNRLVAAQGIQPEQDPLGESIVLQVATVNGRPAAFAAGSGARGVLNAVVELLDQLQYTGEGVILPDVTIRHRPSVAYRGSQHAHEATYDPDDSALLENFRSYIAYMARRRGNTICVWGDWPLANSVLAGYRHFPELYDEAQEPALERIRERARTIVSVAAAYGIDVFLTTPELTYPARLPELHPEIIAVDPPENVRQYKFNEWTKHEAKPHICFTHPVTQSWYKAKVREMFEHVPGAAGLELWVSWADTDVFYCACERCAKLTPAERIAGLLAVALEGLDQAAPGQGKKILLRTYLGGWRQIFEEDFFSPLAGQFGERVTVGNKSQAGDMYYTHPPHPLTGKLAPATPEAVEFCLGGEYRGGNVWGMPAPIAPYLADRMRLYAGQGVDWFIERNRLWQNRLNAPDFDAFYALAWDLNASPAAIWQAWGNRTFGDEAGPRVVEILHDATRVVEKAFYVQGVSFTSHHLLGENLERLRHLIFDRSAKSVDGGLERLQPTTGNIRRILAEKDQAVALSDSILKRVAALSGALPERDFAALSDSLNLQHEMVLMYRQLAEVFWRYLRWEHTLSEVDREFQRQDLVPALEGLHSATQRLRERAPHLWNARLFENLGTAPVTWSGLDFEHQFPYAYFDTIAADIEKRITVQAGSLWGYFPRPQGV